MLVSVIDPDDLRQTLRGVLRRGRVPLAARAARGLEALRGQPVHARGRRRARGSTTSRPSRRRRCSAATRTGAARSGCRSTTSRSASSCIYQRFFGDDFTVEYPTGSGKQRTFGEIAQDLADRIVAIWLPDADGRRPVYGGTERLQTDPAWKDNLLFNEYFHGDNGAGLGATHQTGWTALVADLILDPPRSGKLPPRRPDGLWPRR